MLFLLRAILGLVEILIFLRVIISFLPGLQHQIYGRTIIQLTDPLLRPFQSFTRVGGGPVAFDFSPMIVLLIVHFLRGMLH